MMGMSPRLLRPWASGVHPEAAAWRSAVVANGGSVSASTLKAVADFCKSIDSAGIRDRFYRLNLFAGNSDASLNAVRTPLYRGPSLSGTQYGNATDTNINFVSGDYVETGTTGGLQSDGSTKYLRTGIKPSDMSPVCTDVHASVYSRDVMSSNAQAIGANAFTFFPAYNGDRVYFRPNGPSSGIEGALTITSGHICAVRTGATAADVYRNGSSQGATAYDNGNTDSDTFKLLVFAQGNTDETSAAYFVGKLQMYSLGRGMTAVQAAAFYSAVQTFQAVLGRQL